MVNESPGIAQGVMDDEEKVRLLQRLAIKDDGAAGLMESLESTATLRIATSSDRLNE
jgi:hypothetical protein